MLTNSINSYYDTLAVPDWYRAERFDYCDSFFKEHKRPFVISVIDTLISIITK
jgi:hypothetical protein